MGKEGFEVSLNNYKGASDTLASIVENIAGIRLPAPIKRAWIQVLETLRIADDRLDGTLDAKIRQGLSRDLVTYLDDPANVINFSDPRLAETMFSLKSIIDNLPDRKKRVFLRSLKGILEVTELIKQTPDVKQMSLLTRLEGQLTARLFIAFLLPEIEQSEKYPGLLKTLTRLGRFANTYDTFIDLPSDFMAGEVTLLPTFRNRIGFLVQSFPDAITTIWNLRPDIRLGKQLLSRVSETTHNYSRKH